MPTPHPTKKSENSRLCINGLIFGVRWRALFAPRCAVKGAVLDAKLRAIFARSIQEQGGKTEQQTNECVEKLRADKRYKRDVY
jgi:hypothetical protein